MSRQLLLYTATTVTLTCVAAASIRCGMLAESVGHTVA